MELLAAITGLRELKGDQLQVVVVSDSKYVVDSVNKGWLASWVKKGLRTRKTQTYGAKWCRYWKNTNPCFNGLKGTITILKTRGVML